MTVEDGDEASWLNFDNGVAPNHVKLTQIFEILNRFDGIRTAAPWLATNSERTILK